MRNIRTEWFYNEKSPKEIKCPTLGLLKNKEDALCYLLALNLYPKFIDNVFINHEYYKIIKLDILLEIFNLNI